MDDAKCACGKPLHYADPATRAYVARLCAEHGPCLKITVYDSGRAWMVPRHYVALHGIVGREIAALAARHKWEEVPP